MPPSMTVSQRSPSESEIRLVILRQAKLPARPRDLRRCRRRLSSSRLFAVALRQLHRHESLNALFVQIDLVANLDLAQVAAVQFFMHPPFFRRLLRQPKQFLARNDVVIDRKVLPVNAELVFLCPWKGLSLFGVDFDFDDLEQVAFLHDLDDLTDFVQTVLCPFGRILLFHNEPLLTETGPPGNPKQMGLWQASAENSRQPRLGTKENPKILVVVPAGIVLRRHECQRPTAVREQQCLFPNAA